jgi:hypothetical protein
MPSCVTVSPLDFGDFGVMEGVRLDATPYKCFFASSLLQSCVERHFVTACWLPLRP